MLLVLCMKAFGFGEVSDLSDSDCVGWRSDTLAAFGIGSSSSTHQLVNDIERRRDSTAPGAVGWPIEIYDDFRQPTRLEHDSGERTAVQRTRGHESKVATRKKPQRISRPGPSP